MCSRAEPDVLPGVFCSHKEDIFDPFLTFPPLRHTFGTYLIAMGYDMTVAKELLGHEDIKTTMLYAKADTRLIRDAIRSFDVLERMCPARI